MKYRLSLEQRLSRLEKIVYEKNASRSHAPSKIFLVWKFLYDRNGALREAIKNSFPEEDQNSISSVLLDGLEEGVFTQNGETYFANKNYVWDDIGTFDDNDKKEIVKDLQYLTNRIQ